MTNKFVSVLDKIGDGIKWFFTNKTAQEIESAGINIAEIAFPEVATLLGGIGKSLAVAQGLAAQAPSGLSTSAMTALVLSDAQQAFTIYEQATGTQFESAQQQQIINLFAQLLSNIPGSNNTGSTTATTATSAAPAAPAPNVQTQASTGTLL